MAEHIDSRAMREKAPETYDEKLAQLRELRQEAIHNAGQVAVDKQHAKGKFTARERIAKLLDPGSFQELDVFVRHRTTDFDMQRHRPYGDAVVTGHVDRCSCRAGRSGASRRIRPRRMTRARPPATGALDDRGCWAERATAVALRPTTNHRRFVNATTAHT